MANYIDEHKNKIQETPGGKLCQVFGKTENASCSIALVEMDQNNNGVKHYHDNITEIYIFTKGKSTKHSLCDRKNHGLQKSNC